MNSKQSELRQPYQPPQLEQHQQYQLLTGLSLPIGNSVLGDSLEVNDFMEEQQ